MFMKFMTGSANKEISYNEFVEMIEKNEIESVVVDSDKITIYPAQKGNTNPFIYAYSGSPTYYTGKMEDDDVGVMPRPAPRMNSPLGLISVTSITATSMSP